MSKLEKEELRLELIKLNAERSNIEKEICALNNVLLAQKVGMTEALVDNEGFPRNDIDIYQVRFARNKICSLQTDIKEVMKKIEIGLLQYYQQNPEENHSN